MRSTVWLNCQIFVLKPLLSFPSTIPPRTPQSASTVPHFCQLSLIFISKHICFTVEASWNVMAHTQKPDFVFRAKRTSPFKSAGGGASFQSTTDCRGVRISSNNAGYTIFRGSVKGTGYPLHSPVSPSLPLPCVTVCHHIWTGVYDFIIFKDCSCYIWHLLDLKNEMNSKLIFHSIIP